MKKTNITLVIPGMRRKNTYNFSNSYRSLLCNIQTFSCRKQMTCFLGSTIQFTQLKRLQSLSTSPTALGYSFKLCHRISTDRPTVSGKQSGNVFRLKQALLQNPQTLRYILSFQYTTQRKSNGRQSIFLLFGGGLSLHSIGDCSTQGN